MIPAKGTGKSEAVMTEYTNNGGIWRGIVREEGGGGGEALQGIKVHLVAGRKGITAHLVTGRKGITAHLVTGRKGITAHLVTGRGLVQACLPRLCHEW